MGSGPFELLTTWCEEAAKTGRPNPEAMTLATVGMDGKPSARIVLFKGLVGEKLTFFTNYESRKGREMANNPFVAACFYWHTLERQIRIEGRVQKMDREDSEAYFRSRPRGSQIGAWASQQSQEISGFKYLADQNAIFEAKFADKDVPLPPYWGGYYLIPHILEFWTGRPSRLHERQIFSRGEHGWQKSYLSP